MISDFEVCNFSDLSEEYYQKLSNFGGHCPM